MNRKTLNIISVIICISAFSFPFLLHSDNNFDIKSKFTLSFTALASVATVLTLLVALLLYKKLSINSVLIQRQTDKVLELVDLLKGRMVNIETEKFTYFSRFNIDEEHLFNSGFYNEIAGRAILIRYEEFSRNINPIIDISNNYLIPEEIREKIEFLKMVGTLKIPDSENMKNYAKMRFDAPINEKDEWVIMLPSREDMFSGMVEPVKIEESQFLVNDYVSSKNLLIKTIDKWLKANSDIQLNLRMAEPNQGYLLKEK